MTVTVKKNIKRSIGKKHTNKKKVQKEKTKKMNAIIVLGHRLNPDGSLPSTLISRIDIALDRWRNNKKSIVLCTGGDAANIGKSEALVMSEQLKKSEPDISRCCVLEENSMTTVGNAVECIPILKGKKIDKIDLVSSDYHLPRATYFFEAVLKAYGLENIPVTPVVAPTPLLLSTDKGINRKSLEQKVVKELRYVSFQLKPMLIWHNPNFTKYISSLSSSRQKRVRKELESLLSKTRSKLQSRGGSNDNLLSKNDEGCCQKINAKKRIYCCWYR